MLYMYTFQAYADMVEITKLEELGQSDMNVSITPALDTVSQQQAEDVCCHHGFLLRSFTFTPWHRPEGIDLVADHQSILKAMLQLYQIATAVGRQSLACLSNLFLPKRDCACECVSYL